MKPKMTKSWAVTLLFTLLTAILPIINEPLAEYGIHITEEELFHYLGALGLTAGIGAGNAALKRKQKDGNGGGGNPGIVSGGMMTGGGGTYIVPDNERLSNPNAQRPTTTIQKPEALDNVPGVGSVPNKKHVTSGVAFGPAKSWYQTNFVKTNAGNTLPFGQSYLWVKIPSAHTYIGAILYNGQGAKIQIDQSSDHDEDNDHTTLRLEMFSKNGAPLPRGDYRIDVTKDGGGQNAREVDNDRFVIV